MWGLETIFLNKDDKVIFCGFGSLLYSHNQLHAEIMPKRVTSINFISEFLIVRFQNLVFKNDHKFHKKGVFSRFGLRLWQGTCMPKSAFLAKITSNLDWYCVLLISVVNELSTKCINSTYQSLCIKAYILKALLKSIGFQKNVSDLSEDDDSDFNLEELNTPNKVED